MEDKNICENCGHGKEKHPYTSWFGSKKLFTCKRFKPKTQSQDVSTELLGSKPSISDKTPQNEQAKSRKADGISDKEMVAYALKSKSNKRDGSFAGNIPLSFLERIKELGVKYHNSYIDIHGWDKQVEEIWVEAIRKILERIDDYRNQEQYKIHYEEAGIFHKTCLEVKEIIKSEMGDDLI